ncbi:MAG: sulfite exporter TauE/SafE family protein [Gammaproteobacteria bacterium]|nr:MAG: sulfite exporter TauE/SafE family protein [Gammaproteobacteria bacterium]
MDAMLMLVPAGLLAGLVAGLFGVGGGLIYVPVLYGLYTLGGTWPAELRMHVALGTSLGAVLITSLASLRAHRRQGTIEWPVVRHLGLGLAFGALLGAWVASRLDAAWLRRGFGGFECLVALQLLQGGGLRLRGAWPGPRFWALAGTGIGTVSALLGIGGGTLTVPLLAWARVPMERAVGTSAACGVPIAVAGAAGYLFWGRAALPQQAGFLDPLAMLALGAGAIFMAPWGARLAVRLPRARLRRLFAVFLLIVGGRLLLE